MTVTELVFYGFVAVIVVVAIGLSYIHKDLKNIQTILEDIREDSSPVRDHSNTPF